VSDPRASIARTVLAPHVPVSAPPAPVGASDALEGVRLIGKPHGRMRCVNLSLTPEAKERLYARATAEGVTLGEALMDLVGHATVRPLSRRPGRNPSLRRGVSTTSVFVLLTCEEASDISQRAAGSGRSVSDFVSTATSQART
jgi:hypothetical protein